ncbi:MAG: response regulator [Verrucomicrobia bacterium]|nr:response regulator [Verrucomicrobiota bacterium]
MTPPEPPSRGSLLFADDDPLVRDGVAELLRRRGFACTCVASGAEAIAQLQQAEFDALISDIHMPGNAGLEMIAAVPQITAGLPVVLLTGRPTVESAAKSVRLSVTAYLTKPPDLEDLIQILDQAIASYRAFRTMRSSRVRLRAWEQELENIEQTIRRSPSEEGGGPMASYLRLTLRQVMLMLADLEHATAALEKPSASTGPLDRVDHVAALRRTVEVLERTKQNFKSKDLADLRKQLEQLLSRTGG